MRVQTTFFSGSYNIETLHRIVKSEQKERCRAIRDTGNYRLSDRYLHHKTDVSFWSTMTEENIQKRTKRFLSDCGKANANTVVSTDGTRTAQRTPSAGRKPHQVKRKRAERSVTPSAKRRLDSQFHYHNNAEQIAKSVRGTLGPTGCTTHRHANQRYQP